MRRIPATVAWAGGLAALCALGVAVWTWYSAERPREVASAAIGPGSHAQGCWPKGLADGLMAAEIANRSGVSGPPAPESSVADPREALPLVPIAQPDVAWEPPLADPLDRGEGRLEVDEECRPIQVARTARLERPEKPAEGGGEAAAEGAGEGEPTLAPPPPPDSHAGRQVIRVVVEAEQTVRKQDAHQP